MTNHPEYENGYASPEGDYTEAVLKIVESHADVSRLRSPDIWG